MKPSEENVARVKCGRKRRISIAAQERCQFSAPVLHVDLICGIFCVVDVVFIQTPLSLVRIVLNDSDVNVKGDSACRR